MSRRGRLEEERLKLLSQELQQEEDRIKAQKERIYAPIIWKRLASGIRIEDLKPAYYDQALQIIQECYFQEEVLCRNANIAEEPESVNSFLKILLISLKDRTSIIAIDEPVEVDDKEEDDKKDNKKKGEKKEEQNEEEKEEEKKEPSVAGFLVMKAMHKDDYGNVFERSIPTEGEAIKKCLTFLNYLGRKTDIYETFNCEVFLKYCILCVRPEYRHKGLGLHLMLCGVDVARSLNIPVMMGIFSSYSLQKRAKKIGMKVILEIDYVRWRDRFSEIIFEDPGVGNYSCAVMAALVPPPPVYVPPPPSAAEQGPKVSREDKRKAKAKAKKQAG